MKLTFINALAIAILCRWPPDSIIPVGENKMIVLQMISRDANANYEPLSPTNVLKRLVNDMIKLYAFASFATWIILSSGISSGFIAPYKMLSLIDDENKIGS